MPLPPILNRNAVDRIKKELPPWSIRVGYGSTSVFHGQVEAVKHLPREDWPTIAGRPAWPSSPTLNELLEMMRRGAKRSTDFVVESGRYVQSTIREFNTNIEFAKRVISRQVIGVRADVKIPAKWHGAFRYRWGFLILTAPYLPAGLARFLASLWCTDPYSLWLERAVTLRQYLRAVPVSIINRAASAMSPTVSLTDSGSGKGPSPEAELYRSGSKPQRDSLSRVSSLTLDSCSDVTWSDNEGTPSPSSRFNRLFGQLV